MECRCIKSERKRASLTTSGFATGNNPQRQIYIGFDRERHLFHFGTETTIGDTTTQDPMFVRFSNQEDLNTYTPTATVLPVHLD